jgi:DNA-binding CsgD family transcriptional regulator
MVDPVTILSILPGKNRDQRIRDVLAPYLRGAAVLVVGAWSEGDLDSLTQITILAIDSLTNDHFGLDHLAVAAAVNEVSLEETPGRRRRGRTLIGSIREALLAGVSGTEAGEAIREFPVPAKSSETAAEPDDPVADLSRREYEVLLELQVGHSNKVIARNLGIAEATVKIYVRNILAKTKTQNRTQAALWGQVRKNGA